MGLRPFRHDLETTTVSDNENLEFSSIATSEAVACEMARVTVMLSNVRKPHSAACVGYFMRHVEGLWRVREEEVATVADKRGISGD